MSASKVQSRWKYVGSLLNARTGTQLDYSILPGWYRL